MAEIQHEHSGQRVVLHAWFTIGRSSRCDLSMSAREVSKQHALITWNGTGWVLRDLHSRNGTWLNGTRISAGVDVPLTVSSSIAFGMRRNQWQVLSLHEPVIHAVCLEDQRVIYARNDLLVLPKPEEPQCTIFQRGSDWFVEDADGQLQSVKDRDVLEIRGQSWRLHIPEPADVTWHGQSLPTPANITLRFGVNPQKELTQVSFVHNNHEVQVSMRVHLQVLFVLAQARMRDARDADLPVHEHGWLYRDELSSMLRIFDNRLYVYVYRAREQFSQIGLMDATDIIERRADTHQVRIGVSRIEVKHTD